MTKFLKFFLCLLILVHSDSLFAGRVQSHNSNWLVSPGIGVWFSPSMFLFNAQLEHEIQPNFYLGPLLQLGVGFVTLLTMSGTVRYVFGRSRIKPTVEGGLGVLFLTGGKFGLHVPLGMGVDYKIDPNISIGTIVRANLLFAPPFGTDFAVSWPLIVGRFTF